MNPDIMYPINSLLNAGCIQKNVGLHFFINVNQTAISFKSNLKYLVYWKARSAFTVDSGSIANSCTIDFTVAATNGLKLLPFFIFKGKPGKTEQKLIKHGILRL
jgi:hypothetical protein